MAIVDSKRECVSVTRDVIATMLAEARREEGIECCGLLAGRDGVIDTVLAAHNVLRSASAYEIASTELFALFRSMRADGLEHLGIYHSHPRGENTPSATDIERAYYPAAAYFIVSPFRDSVRAVRCFRIVDGRVRELAMQVL